MKHILGLPVEKIIKSNRKTIAIEISDNAALIIKAPTFIRNADIERIISENYQWLKKKLEIAQKSKQFKTKRFVNGEKFLYLGKLYPLELKQNLHKPLVFSDKFYLRYDARPQARELFINWYKRQASANFYKRAIIFAPLMGVEFNQLKISSARKRWGSCSNKKNINIVWRLIMAPQPIIDYVIIHELAHLRHMNHSQNFWKLVESVYPHYKQAINWLKEYGPYLDI